MIVLAPKQINSDRIAPGITTSAVCGVEVNLSCDYKTHLPGAGVTLTLLYVQRMVQTEARTHAHTQCEAPNHTKSVREQKGENGCFPNYMPLAALPVRPV